MKKFKRSHWIILTTIIGVWLQTILTYHFGFSLKYIGWLQEIILLINPLPALMVVFGVALFFKKERNAKIYLIITTLVLDIILYANVLFFRFFNDFITLPLLFQTSNFGSLGRSVGANFRIYDTLFWVSFILIIATYKYAPLMLLKISNFRQINKKIYYLTFCFLAFLNLGLQEIARPQLFTRAFDRDLLVRNLGIFNYHIYDAGLQSITTIQKSLADEAEFDVVKNYIDLHKGKVNPAYTGIAKGRNVIIISLESLQNFVINRTEDGQEITPFLNSLTHDKDTIYFDNFYHQTAQGKTSDAEFIVDNSQFALARGAVFFTNTSNTFSTLTQKLNKAGYFTAVQHANNASFWNRSLIYPRFGTQKFYDVNDYTVTPEESVNWGLKDIPFMKQNVEQMSKMKQPFYTKIITLTNHYPFTSDEQDRYIQPYHSSSATVNNYFVTARYLDESIKVLYDELKAKGLYDNSIIIMYGDHYGISENHNEAMAQYLHKDNLTPYDVAELQKIAFFITIPNSNKGHVNSTLGGQLDIRPTLLNLLGEDTSKDFQLGHDLFALDRPNWLAFRDGRFVTNDFIYSHNVCYLKPTGMNIDSKYCEPFKKNVAEQLNVSDKIIYGDLLRFNKENKEK